MRITQRATRQRILSRLDKLEDSVTMAHIEHDRRLADILSTVRDYARKQDALNDEVRRTMTAGPFSPDALSKMFQRMDNQMTVLKQNLDTLCRRGHIHAG